MLSARRLIRVAAVIPAANCTPSAPPDAVPVIETAPATLVTVSCAITRSPLRLMSPFEAIGTARVRSPDGAAREMPPSATGAAETVGDPDSCRESVPAGSASVIWPTVAMPWLAPSRLKAVPAWPVNVATPLSVPLARVTVPVASRWRSRLAAARLPFSVMPLAVTVGVASPRLIAAPPIRSRLAELSSQARSVIAMPPVASAPSCTAPASFGAISTVGAAIADAVVGSTMLLPTSEMRPSLAVTVPPVRSTPPELPAARSSTSPLVLTMSAPTITWPVLVGEAPAAEASSAMLPFSVRLALIVTLLPAASVSELVFVVKLKLFFSSRSLVASSRTALLFSRSVSVAVVR